MLSDTSLIAEISRNMGRIGILSIYCSGVAQPGNGLWSVDVFQDRIRELRHVSWTWTVVSRKQLEADGEDEAGQPEWVIVVDAPFSYDAVRDAVEGWLQARGYRFQVRLLERRLSSIEPTRYEMGG